ncbi:MAG: Arm DNA-binding domain-containing protein [Steroidobacteraceae bacterium]
MVTEASTRRSHCIRNRCQYRYRLSLRATIMAFVCRTPSLTGYAPGAVMGRRSTTGGVTPIGSHRIRFDFTVDGGRFRPTLKWPPNEANLRRARAHLERIRAQIEAAHFAFQRNSRTITDGRPFPSR